MVDNQTTYEICIENHTALAQALAHPKVSRIELCDNLALGGTTVSFGVAQYASDSALQANKPIHAMIRPHGGTFCYNDTDLAIMLEDIALLKKLDGIKGFVVGALTKENHIDIATMQLLINAIKPKATTFHMAFDLVPTAMQQQSIDLLQDLGVAYLLTHGSPANNPIEENLEHLRALAEYAQGKITLIVGKGVTYQNIHQLEPQLYGVQWHGTKIVHLPANHPC
nr:copper homeostasis protein CutC [Entomospira culicis]